MKNLIIIFAFLLLTTCIFSCSKNNDNLSDENLVNENPELSGDWHLTYTTGGWLDNDTLFYPEDTGDTVIWKFSTDSLTVLKNGWKDQIGTYLIINKESQILNQDIDFLIYNELSSFIPIEYMITEHTDQELELTVDNENPLKLKLER